MKAQRKRQQRKNISTFFKEKLGFLFAYLASLGIDLETVGLKKREEKWTPDAIKFKFNERLEAETEEARKTRAKIVSVSRRVNFISDLTYNRFKRSAEHRDFPIDLPTAYETKRICDEAVKEARFVKLYRNNLGYYVAADKKICRVIEENWDILKETIKNNTIR